MNGYKIAVMSWLATTVVLFVAKAGKPRKPISGFEAAAAVVEGGIVFWWLLLI